MQRKHLDEMVQLRRLYGSYYFDLREYGSHLKQRSLLF